MSSLVTIATERLAGRSIDEIAQALDTTAAQVRMIERIGMARVRAVYHRANHLGDVAVELGFTSDDVQLLDEAYHFTTSKKPQPLPRLFELPRNQGEDIKVTALPKKTKKVSSAKTQRQTIEPSSTVAAVAMQTSFLQNILPQPTVDHTLTPQSRRYASYQSVKKVLEPYAREMFLNSADATALLECEQVSAAPHIVRNVLTNLSGGLNHGERVRSWAKTYAMQGRTLVEISRLLGNQHLFATKKLLTSLELHVRDGFELIDYHQTLRDAQSLPDKERNEIELICRGAPYKVIAASQSYSTTRAGQRIDELGLREVWQCAQYLKRAKKHSAIFISQ